MSWRLARWGKAVVDPRSLRDHRQAHAVRERSATFGTIDSASAMRCGAARVRSTDAQGNAGRRRSSPGRRGECRRGCRRERLRVRTHIVMGATVVGPRCRTRSADRGAEHSVRKWQQHRCRRPSDQCCTYACRRYRLGLSLRAAAETLLDRPLRQRSLRRDGASLPVQAP
jgi:hypothetical protein